jgi:tetratricopeptide (TPR) repeat protein
MASLFRAMSYQRLGYTSRAYTQFLQGFDMTLRYWATVEDFNWPYWCFVDIVRREAQDLITGQDSPLFEEVHHLNANGRLLEATNAIDRLLESRPDDSHFLSMRAELYVRLNMWKKAVVDYRRVCESDSDNSLNWLKLAPLLILTEDIEGYRRLCGMLLEKHVRGEGGLSSRSRRAAKVCILIDSEMDQELQPIQELREALSDETASVSYRAWAYLLVALSAFRTGDYAETIRCIQETRNAEGYTDDSVIGVTATLLALMAQHADGVAIESLDSFGVAVATIDNELSKLAAGKSVVSWHDWLIARIHCEEAAQLLGEPALELIPSTWKKNGN